MFKSGVIGQTGVGLVVLFVNVLACRESEPSPAADSTGTGGTADATSHGVGGLSDSSSDKDPISGVYSAESMAGTGPGSASTAESEFLNSLSQSTDALRMAEWEIIRQWDKIKSFSAKVTSRDERGPLGARLMVNGHGTYDLEKTDGLPLVRMEITNETTPHAVGSTSAETQINFSLYRDGIVHTLKTLGEKTTARKEWARPESLIQLGGRHFFQHIHSVYDLKLLPEETLESGDATVIEATPPSLSGTLRYYFDKKTGVLVKLLIELQQQHRQTILIHDLVLNPRFAPDHFVFQVPEGVVVTDLTKPSGEPATP